MERFYSGFHKQNGNVLLIILVAVALIAALTIAIRGLNSQDASISKEELAIRGTEVQRYMNEIEYAIREILNNGYSEGDIRFAHSKADSSYGDLFGDSDKGDQVFHSSGGNATYRDPPRDINDGSGWEFYGHSALPSAGSDRADLIAVLPNITESFCNAVNASIGYMAQPSDTGTCLYGAPSDRFSDSTQFSSSPNTTVATSFSVKPAMRGCVVCGTDRHYFYVLMAR